MSPGPRCDLWRGPSSDSRKQTQFDTCHHGKYPTTHTQTKQHKQHISIYPYQRSSASHESCCCSSFHVSTTKSSSKENFSFPPCFGSKSRWDILSVAPDRREGNQFVTDEIPENTSIAQTGNKPNGVQKLQEGTSV